jgi:hypothetical protein
MRTVELPSTQAAWHFVVDAQQQGYDAEMAAATKILPRTTFWAIVIGALLGGTLLALVGALAEAGRLGLPRLEPLFAAPVGAVTALLATIGGSFGALIGGFIGLHPVPPLAGRDQAQVYVNGENEEETEQLIRLSRPVPR